VVGGQQRGTEPGGELDIERVYEPQVRAA